LTIVMTLFNTLVMSGYRPPSRPPRGRWAQWLHRRRRELGLSQTQAFERLLAAGMPWSPKSRATYVAIDMGDRQPRPDEAEILARVFGKPDESIGEEEDLVRQDRIDRLLALVESLLDEIARERARAVVREEVLLKLLGNALGPEAREAADEQLALQRAPTSIRAGDGD
jgi:transcriptional regulator with XRE-family HTH domain